MTTTIEILQHLSLIDVDVEVFYAQDAFTQKEYICVNPRHNNRDVMYQEGSSTYCGYAYGTSFDEALRDVWWQLKSAEYIILEVDKGYWNEGAPIVEWIEDRQRTPYKWNGTFFEEYI